MAVHDMQRSGEQSEKNGTIVADDSSAPVFGLPCTVPEWQSECNFAAVKLHFFVAITGEMC